MKLNILTSSKTTFTLLLVFSFVACQTNNPQKTGFEGKSLPSFNLLLSDSATYLNTANIPVNKPCVLFFFGPNCPYSKAQMEEIIKNMDNLRDIQFYIFTDWPFNEMKKFYSKYHLDKYNNVKVGFDYKDFYVNYYKVAGVPYTCIFGKDKKLKNAFLGKVEGRQIKEIAFK